MVRLLRHRQTKGAETDRLDLWKMGSCSLLYPPLTPPLFGKQFQNKALGRDRTAVRMTNFELRQVQMGGLPILSHIIIMLLCFYVLGACKEARFLA